IDEFDYETGRQQRSFDTYNDIDCFHYAGLHDAIKERKHGYGKVHDHACREIRLRRLTREQAQILAEQYGDIRPVDTRLFCEWLGIDEAAIWSCVDRHRDAIAGAAVEPSADQINAARLGIVDDCEFRITPSKAP